MSEPLDLDALQAVCDAATPGMWIGSKNPIDECWRSEFPADAAFIAHARTAMPQLIARVRIAEDRALQLDHYISGYISEYPRLEEDDA